MCKQNFKKADEESKKKDATIETLNKDLEEKIKTIVESKKKEDNFAKENSILELIISDLKTKASKTNSKGDKKGKNQQFLESFLKLCFSKVTRRSTTILLNSKGNEESCYQPGSRIVYEIIKRILRKRMEKSNGKKERKILGKL